MKQIYTTFAFLFVFAVISSAQLSVNLQYSHDFRQSSSENNPNLYNYYPTLIIDDCFNCYGYNYYGDEEYKRVQNYTYGANIRYKKKRFAFQLGMMQAVRDFRIQVSEMSRDDARRLVYVFEQTTGSRTELFPLPTDKVNDYGIYTHELNYLGVSPEIQFFWANYDQLSSYIGFGATIFERLTSDANGQIYPVADMYSTFHATFGFEQRIGKHFLVNFGGKYQRGNKDYAGNDPETYGVRALSAFLGVGYSL